MHGWFLMTRTLMKTFFRKGKGDGSRFAGMIVLAALGALLGPCLGLPAAAAAALGYASVFGAASNTLLAPILIGAELFGLESLPCFMICAVCAYLANGGRSIYPQRRESGFSGAETAISGHRQKKIDK